MNLYRMPGIFIGRDATKALADVLVKLDAKRVFVVTGPHVSRSAEFADLMKIASANGRHIEIFSDTTADPTIETVNAAGAKARTFGANCVIGVGGGSPLDSAKIVAVLAEREADSASFVGNDLVPKRKIPLLMVPTTAGTASEVTIYSILTDTKARMKAAICSSEIIPDYAFLIPEMTYSMPPKVTAATGMDALCHATEAYLSKRRNPYSDIMALRAVHLISSNLRKAQKEPTNAEAREAMQLASLFAGLAFGNASVTAVHAFAYPLGGMHHIAHGLANSLMFTPVFRHNTAGNEKRLSDLAEAFSGIRYPLALMQGVESLKRDLGLPMSLREVGIPEGDLDTMAGSVMTVTRLLNMNPSVITLEDARRIYREAYAGGL